MTAQAGSLADYVRTLEARIAALERKDKAQYVTGSWTPTLSFGGDSVNMTYNTSGANAQLGRYVRIGNLVWVLGRVTLSAKGISTGTFRLEGLPFTIANANVAFSVVASALSGMTTTEELHAAGVGGTTYCTFYRNHPSGSLALVTNTQVSDTTQIFAAIIYETS